MTTFLNRIRNADWLRWLLSLVRAALPADPPQPQPVVIEPQPQTDDKALHRFFVKQTLSDLLDDLDAQFEAAKIPFGSQSWIDRDLAVGLKKLGPHVPAAIHVSALEAESIDPALLKSPPQLMALAGGDTPKYEDKKSGEGVMPNYIFAMRKDKRPHDVHTHSNGVLYYVGCGWRLGKYRRHGEPRMYWFGYFAVVNKETGQIDICDQKRSQSYEVGRKSKRRRNTFTRNEWTHQDFFYRAPDEDEYQKEDRARKDRRGRRLFSTLYTTWAERDHGWSVAVTKNGERVTFGVPTEKGQTAKFFQDRDKSIRTASGATKKIIHIVREHNRLTATGKLTSVRSHLRGLDRFDWKGYGVIVRSPKFHGIMGVSQPDFEELEDDDPRVPQGIHVSRLGKLLADMEDSGIKTGGATRLLNRLDQKKELH